MTATRKKTLAARAVLGAAGLGAVAVAYVTIALFLIVVG